MLLPEDCVVEVLSHVDVNSLLMAHRVNTLWLTLVRRKELWRRVCEKLWPGLTEQSQHYVKLARTLARIGPVPDPEERIPLTALRAPGYASSEDVSRWEAAIVGWKDNHLQTLRPIDLRALWADWCLDTVIDRDSTGFSVPDKWMPRQACLDDFVLALKLHSGAEFLCQHTYPLSSLKSGSHNGGGRRRRLEVLWVPVPELSRMGQPGVFYAWQQRKRSAKDEVLLLDKRTGKACRLHIGATSTSELLSFYPKRGELVALMTFPDAESHQPALRLLCQGGDDLNFVELCVGVNMDDTWDDTNSQDGEELYLSFTVLTGTLEMELDEERTESWIEVDVEDDAPHLDLDLSQTPGLLHFLPWV